MSEECEEASGTGADLAASELQHSMDAHLIHGRGQKRAEQRDEEQKIKAWEHQQFKMTQLALQEHIYLC